MSEVFSKTGISPVEEALKKKFADPTFVQETQKVLIDLDNLGVFDL